MSLVLLRETDEVNLGGGGGGGGMFFAAGGGIEEILLGGGGGSMLFREGEAVPFDGRLFNFFGGSTVPISFSMLGGNL